MNYVTLQKKMTEAKIPLPRFDEKTTDGKLNGYPKQRLDSCEQCTLRVNKIKMGNLREKNEPTTKTWNRN